MDVFCFSICVHVHALGIGWSLQGSVLTGIDETYRMYNVHVLPVLGIGCRSVVVYVLLLCLHLSLSVSIDHHWDTFH